MNKNKIGFIIFITICVLLCMIPSVCMIFARSDEPIGNESTVSLPSWKDENGAFNEEVLSDFGDYFETHYAFRPQMITADAKIQKAVFNVSNADTVVTGTDGWLYYSSTLNDHLGREQLSERGMFNLAHNISLLQQYVEAKGADFLFMIPPNKNSLYGEHMPYYYRTKTGSVFNRDRLKESLSGEDVHYLDVFELFQSRDEILYLKQDSHWNNKGACMVYNEMMSALQREHETYDNAEVTFSKSHSGDLSEMIYPASTDLEMDYTYDYEPEFEYISIPTSSDPVSVEDFRIETKNEKKEDQLLMYRDSFGNTLIPFVANEFGSAFFTKGTPYTLSLHMNQYQPDVVIMEKVERNMKDFAVSPGIIPAAQVSSEGMTLKLVSNAESNVKTCEADVNYVEISGTVPDDQIEGNARIFLQVKDPLGREQLYEAFTVTNETSDYGYLAYLPLDKFGTVESIEKSAIIIYTD